MKRKAYLGRAIRRLTGDVLDDVSRCEKIFFGVMVALLAVLLMLR